MVTSTPSTFGVDDRPRITSSRATVGTSMGTHTAFWPRAPKLLVRRTGDSAYRIGSPMIGYNRVAPFKRSSIFLLLRADDGDGPPAVGANGEQPGPGPPHPTGRDWPELS